MVGPRTMALLVVSLSFVFAQSPCALTLEVRDVGAGRAVEPEAVRRALELELREPVRLGPAADCGHVTMTVDVGVVTIKARRSGSEEATRLLPLTASTDLVNESVWLAAGTLRNQLEAHLRSLPATPSASPVVPERQPAPPAAAESDEQPSPRWWLELTGLLGSPMLANFSVGFDARAQWRRRLLVVGLSTGHSQGLERPRVALRTHVLAEAGLVGGPGRLRLGVMLGFGPAWSAEGDRGAETVLVGAFRPRVVIGVSLGREIELAFTGSMLFATDVAEIPRHFLSGGLTVTYGLDL